MPKLPRPVRDLIKIPPYPIAGITFLVAVNVPAQKTVSMTFLDPRSFPIPACETVRRCSRRLSAAGVEPGICPIKGRPMCGRHGPLMHAFRDRDPAVASGPGSFHFPFRSNQSEPAFHISRLRIALSGPAWRGKPHRDTRDTHPSALWPFFSRLCDLLPTNNFFFCAITGGATTARFHLST